MGFLAFLGSAVSALVAGAGGLAHQLRSFNVAPRTWTCVECGIPNELDRDTCWSCEAGYGEDPLYPSHIPMDRRWPCPSCAVWNGIARTESWRCGMIRDGSPVPWPPDAAREPLVESPHPGSRDASQRRLPPQHAGGAASRRGNS